VIFLPPIFETKIKRAYRSTAGARFTNRSCGNLLKKLYGIQTSNGHLQLHPKQTRTHSRWKRNRGYFRRPEDSSYTRPNGKKPKSPPHRNVYGSSIQDSFKKYFLKNPDEETVTIDFLPRNFDDPKFADKAQKALDEFIDAHELKLMKIIAKREGLHKRPFTSEETELFAELVDRVAGVLMAKKIAFDAIGISDGEILLFLRTEGTHPINEMVRRIQHLYGDDLYVLFQPMRGTFGGGSWSFEENTIYIGHLLVSDVGHSNHQVLIHEGVHAYNAYSLLNGNNSPVLGAIFAGKKGFNRKTKKMVLPKAFLNKYGKDGFHSIDEIDAFARGSLADFKLLVEDLDYLNRVWRGRLLDSKKANHFPVIFTNVSIGSEVSERALIVAKDVREALKKGIEPKYRIAKVGDREIVYASIVIRKRKKNYVFDIPLVGGNINKPDDNLALLLNQLNDLEIAAKKHQTYFHFLRLVYDKMAYASKDEFSHLLDALVRTLPLPSVRKEFPTFKELISKFNGEII